MRISTISVSIIFLGLLPLICTGEPVLAQSDNLPGNEQIMYGGKEKNAAQKAADRKFLAAVERRGISRRDAAIHASKRGFQFLRKGDLSTAIKRFNQAWLLDAEYGGAYWGFAIIAHQRDKDAGAAQQMFARAAELLPRDADLQVDMGRFYGKSGDPAKAISFFKRALELDENARDAHMGLTTAYSAQLKFRQAMEHAIIAKKRNEPLPKNAVPFFACMTGMIEKGLEPNQKNAAPCMRLLRSGEAKP